MSTAIRIGSLHKVGIIGSGQIGPDIALHFAKVLSRTGAAIEVVDIDDSALERGRTKLRRKVSKGVESGAFKPEMGEAMIGSVTFSNEYDRLRDAEFIVEAATEDRDLKRRIFSQLEDLCGDAAVFASNSSHLEPEEIFAPLARRDRTLVIHYFFPAERNPLVEIVPGEDTAPALTTSLMAFYEAIGKVPIQVGSRYGYAVDPIFEGIFLAAALCVEAGMGSTKEVDAAAARALGQRVGPFTAMNLTGGNPITNHGLDQSTEKIGPWFHSPALLKEAVKTGEPWEVPARGETVEVPAERERQIADVMRGAYFGLAGEIVDAGISTVSDLDMALEIGLDIRPPFYCMNRMGVANALKLVRAYASDHPGFPVPECLERQAATGEGWPISHLVRRDVGDVAVVTIRRPRVLNALSAALYTQLHEEFQRIENDPKVRAAVLTGFGVKAFVSGADIKFLATIDSPELGFETCESSKQAGTFIERMATPVVCALNGFAFGGGLELAMCCHARLCAKGLKMAGGLPEVNLGIIPGSGGTQRLPRLIGLEAAATLLRTGAPIPAAKAIALGLVQEADGELIDAAVTLARSAADGTVTFDPMPSGPMETPAALADIELRHLSRATDGILVRAILEGCRKPLSEGLRFESEMFAECCRTQDMKIGVTNFLKNGPKAKAEFVHA